MSLLPLGQLVLTASAAVFAILVNKHAATLGVLLLGLLASHATLVLRGTARSKLPAIMDLLVRALPFAVAGYAVPALTAAPISAISLLQGSALTWSLVAITFLQPALHAGSRRSRLAAFVSGLAVAAAVSAGSPDQELLVSEMAFGLLVAAGAMMIEVILTAAEADRQSARHDAEHDHLTGLLNRRGLERAFAELRTEGRPGRYLCLLYLDVDGFKAVNDRFGHAAADKLLQEIGQSIARCFPSDHAIARIGGDEFVVLFRHDSVAEATGRAQQLVLSLDVPFASSHPIRPQAAASIGVGICEVKSADYHELLLLADRALYEAKAAGKAAWRAKEMTAQL
jgi:diguanylate cyclase (GGDEF)-like protein